MIGLRYGTVPIVRAVGGLAVTVFDKDYAEKPQEERNRFVFSEADYTAIESTLYHSIGLWYQYPEQFMDLAKRGMRYDYSWNHPGENYLNIHEYIRHK